MWLLAAVGALFAVARPAQALDPHLAVSQYVFDNWQIQQGLPQNSVEALARTPDGYLWLATHEGLVRFDGVRFTVFDRDNTPQLRSRIITRLHVDDDGRLWVGTRVGVLVYFAGQFHEQQMAGLRDGYVRAIVSDKNGHVWIGTDQALFEIDGTNVHTYGREQGLEDTAIRALQAGNRTMWVGTNIGGLYRLGAERFEKVTVDSSAGSDAVRAMFEDDDGAIWIGTEDGRLFRGRDGQFVAYAPAQNLGSAVSSILRDRDGNLWIGTTGNGALRLAADEPELARHARSHQQRRARAAGRSRRQSVARHVRRGSRAPAQRQVHSVRTGGRSARQSRVDCCAIARRQPVARHRCGPDPLRERQVRIPRAAARSQGRARARSARGQLGRRVVRHARPRPLSTARRQAHALLNR